MARTCTVCAHEESFAINEALVVDREPNRRIAAHYGLSEPAIRRHRHHVPQLLVEASEAGRVADADDLLEDIERIRESAFDLLDRAERSHDWRARIGAIRECRENVRILGELHGRLEASRANVQINLVASPEWTSLKAVIIGALREHPAALEAVAAAVSRKEITNGP